MASGAPTGTVTFLFTDIVGSTEQWEDHPTEMRAALATHDRLARDTFSQHDGHVFATGGDGFAVAFQRAAQAVDAAAGLQTAVETEVWPDEATIAVRIGLHTGEAEERDGDYFGAAVNRAARISAAAHGGQVICSRTTADLVDAETTDLGVHRLRGVAEPMAISQIDVAGVRRVFEPLRTVAAATSNLPTTRSPLLGRGDELAHAVEGLRTHRLVTLLGPGGIGKTRLAIDVARAVLASSPDGAFFVDLAAINSDDEVVHTIAAGMHISPLPTGDLLGQVIDAVEDRRVLIVLDNCEHVIDEVADAVDTLLDRCSEARILATSREALSVDGEEILPVRPLAEEFGLELFLERAARSVDDDPTTREAIASICRRLDGLPLAIELAAARTGVLTVTDIRDRLDERFALLTGGRRRTRGRQATLEAAIDWSYDLLDEPSRRALACISVMPGLFDLPMAAAAIGCDESEALTLLEGLAAQSLVVVGPGIITPTGYRLLETVRTYGAAKLRALDERETRERHAREILRRPFRRVVTSPDSSALADDIMAAHDWAAGPDGHPDLVGPLTTARFNVFFDRWDLDRADEAEALVGTGTTEEDGILLTYLAVVHGVTGGRIDGYARSLTKVIEGDPRSAQSMIARVFRMPQLSVLDPEQYRVYEAEARAIATELPADLPVAPWIDFAQGLASAFHADLGTARERFETASRTSTVEWSLSARYALTSLLLVDAIEGVDLAEEFVASERERFAPNRWLERVMLGRLTERDLESAYSIRAASLGDTDAAIEHLQPRLDLRRAAVGYHVHDERVLTLVLAALHHHRGDDEHADLAIGHVLTRVMPLNPYELHLRCLRAGKSGDERFELFQVPPADDAYLEAVRRSVNDRCLVALGIDP